MKPENAEQQPTKLTKAELVVLEQIRKKNLSKLTIRFDQNREISLIEATETMNKVDAEARYKDHIKKRGYQEISISTQGGKIVKFNRITKQKIK